MPEHDPRISEIFYFFEEHTTVQSGRAHGRKIGVMQEILLLKYLMAHPALGSHLYLERLLEGASGTTHKVEFAWYRTQRHVVRPGKPVPGLSGVTLVDTSATAGSARFSFGGRRARLRVSDGVLPPTALTNVNARAVLAQHHADLRLQKVRDSACEVDVVDFDGLVASLESKRVGAQRFSASEKLGSGIQTIEKAKQASLVAVDLSRQWNEDRFPPVGERAYISLVALGNGVHWTTKDRQIFAAYVDYTFTVRDEAIIRYFEFVDRSRPDEIDQLTHFTQYFKGMTRFAGDAFAVTDDDFEIVAPEGETRSLAELLTVHLERIDP